MNFAFAMALIQVALVASFSSSTRKMVTTKTWDLLLAKKTKCCFSTGMSTTLTSSRPLYSNSNGDGDGDDDDDTEIQQKGEEDFDPVALLPLWEAELSRSKSDLTSAGQKRHVSLLEKIENAKTAAEFGVRKAQFSFYDAFSNQDLGGMKEVWSKGPNVRCVHPGMPSLDCLEDILQSWEDIFSQGGNAFIIEPTRTSIDVSGHIALCSCVEVVAGSGQLECLNVYRRENGSWKMVLHMASPVAVRM